jgi:hypothetical protein
MSEDKKTFSVSAVLITAVVSFVVSGVGGALFQRHLARAKPSVTVTAAGFEGAQDLVELPDKLIDLSQEDSWGPSLVKYERYGTLRDREGKSGEIEARLSKAIAAVELWLRESENGSDQVSTAELLRHPMLTDETFGSSINGYIRRTELPPPPYAGVTDRASLFPIFQRDGEPEIHTGKTGIPFPSNRFQDSKMHEVNRLVAESFSRGVRKNISHYSKIFLENERLSVLRLKELRAALQSVLLDQARPTVTVTLQNSGDTSVALRPYFGLAVLGTDQKSISDRYVLVAASAAPNSEDVKGLMGLLQDREESEKSKQVKVDPYLPRVGGLTYTTIAPGSSLSLRLVAIDRLGAKGAQYRTAYESGLLTTKVLATTASGEKIWSDASVFGANLNKKQQDAVIEQLK